MDKLQTLKHYFGHDGFRPGQEALVDALLLAAGKLAGIAAGLARQTKQVEDIRYAPAYVFFRNAGHLQCEGDIAEDRHGRDQPEILKHHADCPPESWDFTALHIF